MAGQRRRGRDDLRANLARRTSQVDARRNRLCWRRLAATAAKSERHHGGQRTEVKRFHDYCSPKLKRHASPFCIAGVLGTISADKR
jgi:hypothetical protein